MAINTSGHGVRMMPQYTAPNPSLVAFNPTQVTDGMLQAFQIAKQYEALKASKALQAELEATRTGRIASTNKGYDVALAAGDKTLRQMPRVEEIEGLGFDAKAKTIMPEADFRLLQMREQGRAMPAVANKTISDSEYGIARNNANINNLPVIAEADNAAARAQTATSNNTIALAPLQQTADAAKLRFGATTADLGNIMAPMQAQLEAFRLGDQMGNAAQDAATVRESKRLSAELVKSQIAENLAQAEYALGLGRQSSGRVETPIERAKKLQALIKELDTMKVGDGTRTLSTYLSDTYEGDKVKQTGIPFFKSPVEQDLIGDFYLKQRKLYQQELLNIQNQMNGGSADPAATPPSSSSSPTRFVKDKNGNWVPKQ